MFSKTEALKNYLNNYPRLFDWLYLNVVIESPGNTSLLTDSDNTLATYIDGSAEKEYIFSVSMVHNYDDGTSDINLQALNESENLIAWINKNNEEQNLPDFGEKCEVESIETIDNIPRVSVDGEKKVAQYIMSMRVNYTERR